MKRYFLLLSACFYCFLAFSFSACKKDPDTPGGGTDGPVAGTAVPADNNNFIRMQIDGTAWSADNEVQVLQAKPTAMAFWNLQLFGTNMDGSNFQVALQRLDGSQVGAGTYLIEGNTQYSVSVQMAYSGDNYAASFETPPGQVVFSELAGRNASGSFEMKMRSIGGQDSLVVTAGSFASNNYGVVE